MAWGSSPKKVVGGPNGMTEKTTRAGTMISTGPER